MLNLQYDTKMPHHENDAALEINSTDCPTKIVGVSFYRRLLRENGKSVCLTTGVVYRLPP